MEKIKIASRSSRLALKQTEIVSESLKKFFEIEVVKVSTTGDKLLNKPLYKQFNHYANLKSFLILST